MATFNRFSSYNGPGGYDKSDPREDLIVKPMDAAQDKIKATGFETLALLAALPQALVRAQERELKRLAASGKDENDPQVIALKAALERAAVLRETATRGQARLDRLVAPVDRSLTIFTGFVSDNQLRPLSGLRVQVSEPQAAPLSAVTDDQGYFSIVLGKNSRAFSGVRRDTSGMLAAILGAKADLKNATVKAEAAAAAAAAAAEAGATVAPAARAGKVEIFDAAGKLLHEDPYPLSLDQGNQYREYLLAAGPERDPKSIYETGPVRNVRASRREAAGTPGGASASPSADTAAAPAADVSAADASAAAAADVTSAAGPESTTAKPPRIATRPTRATAKPAAPEASAAPPAAAPAASADLKPGTVKPRASAPEKKKP